MQTQANIDQQLIQKAATLLEALPYIQRYRGSYFVIKYGGSFMDSPDPQIRTSVAKDIVFLQAVGIKPVIVHGGGKAITKAMVEKGIQSRFIQGLRVTDEQTVQIVDQVLSYQINPEIVSYINAFGGRAIGIPGPKIFRARKTYAKGPDAQELDLGYVGQIVKIDTSPVIQALEQAQVPVISPTALGESDAHLYNCNADLAATELAIAIQARWLIFMSDVPGLLRNIHDPTSLISKVRVDELSQLKHSGVIDGGMIPKVESAAHAIRSGIEKVSFIDGRLPHALLIEIFSGQPIGTEITK